MNHQNLNEEQKVLAVAENNCVAVNMDNSRIACLEIAKTMKSDQLLCGRGIPGKDEGFENGNFLNLALLTILCFISFIHKMYEDMPCMHRILHVGKNSENYTFIMNH